MFIKKTTEKVNVQVQLTEQERVDSGMKLADALNAKDDLLNELQKYQKEIKAKISGLDASIESLLRIVQTGREWRSVECKVLINPATGRKTWMSGDGEVVKETGIPSEDLQGDLFEEVVA